MMTRDVTAPLYGPGRTLAMPMAHNGSVTGGMYIGVGPALGLDLPQYHQALDPTDQTTYYGPRYDTIADTTVVAERHPYFMR